MVLNTLCGQIYAVPLLQWVVKWPWLIVVHSIFQDKQTFLLSSTVYVPEMVDHWKSSCCVSWDAPEMLRLKLTNEQGERCQPLESSLAYSSRPSFWLSLESPVLCPLHRTATLPTVLKIYIQWQSENFFTNLLIVSILKPDFFPDGPMSPWTTEHE